MATGNSGISNVYGEKEQSTQRKWSPHQTAPMANKHIHVTKLDNAILTHHIGRKHVLSAYGGLVY